MSEEAPGRLDVVRRFLNTVSFERNQDALAGPDELPAWCAENGLDCDGERLARLRRFREALREAALANGGHGDRHAAWLGIEPFARESSLQVRIQQGVPSLAPSPNSDDPAIALLLAIVYDAVRTGEWQRFKACRATDCRWAFYDRSKNGSGTWCSMAVCGNRLKARRRRQRASGTPKVAVDKA